MFKPTHVAVESNANVRCGELLQHITDIQYLNENGGVVVISKHQVIPIENKTDMLLPTEAQERKQIPIVSGVLDYFPLAIAEVAKCSKAGNDQHHPGEPLFWDKTSSMAFISLVPSLTINFAVMSLVLLISMILLCIDKLSVYS